MGHALDQPVRLEPAHGLSQWAARDTVGLRQARFGDLAARHELASHDGILELMEDPLRQRSNLGICLFGCN